MKTALYSTGGRACGPADYLVTEMMAILDIFDGDT